MEHFIKNLKKKIAECSEWPKVSNVLENAISPEHIPHFLEILKEFSINDPEIDGVIETNLDEFLNQMKTVCYHIISTFYANMIRDTKKTEFFTIHVKWFYVIFVYFALKRMVCKKIIDWPNFRANQDIQKMFIDSLMNYESDLPLDYYDIGLKPDFRIMITYITSSPSCNLEGIGGVPYCVFDD
jgi:hypothetical protein